MLTAILLSFWLVTVSPFETGDLCPPNWEYVRFTHSCYLRAARTLPWEEAKDFCKDRGYGSHLATILSKNEMEAVYWMIDEFLTWIGLRLDPEPMWVDGSPVNYTQFLEGNHGLQEGPCVAWQVNSEQNGWKPIACNYSQFFMCKKAAKGEKPTFQIGNSGRFNSPGYPTGYSNDLFWHHIIETEPGTRVEITFTNLDLEYWRDFVEVMDIGDQPPVSLVRLTGKLYDRAVISRSNKVAVVFKTDEDVTASGFHAHWRAKQPDADIEEHYEKEGEIRSIPYPGPIKRFSVQRHLIKCSPENHVVITLKECYLTETDWLRFYQEPRNDFKLPHFHGVKEETTFSSKTPIVFVRYEGTDGEKWSQRWRFEYYCQRDDGLGDEIIIP